VLGEMASLEKGSLMPELSYGTHFFQDLVENNIFFVAIFPWREGVTLRTEWLDPFRNRLPELLPDYESFAGVVKVYDMSAENLRIIADVVLQRIVCFRDSQ